MGISQRGRCRSCGGQLASDHRADLCSACARRTGVSGPPADLPPTFWDDPTLRQALSERHMGKAIAAYRANPAHRNRIRQVDVAAWAGITQVRLSHIENGQPLQHLDKLIDWAQLLGIPEELLWFQLPGRVAHDPIPPQPIPPAGPASRYRLVRLADPDTSDDPDLAAMHAFRSCDSEVGGGHLYSEVITYLTTDIGPRLFGGDPATTRQTFTATAGLTEMAGWMAHDGGNDPQAYRHLFRALELAKAGGDPQLIVHVHASLSHLALYLARPRDAIRHAYDGQTALKKAPSNLELAARLWAMQARGFAALHQHRESLHMLDRAATILTDPHPDSVSPWVSRFDQGSLSSEAARCWRQIGDLGHARDHAEQILALRPAHRVRSRAFASLTLATILAQQGEPERACAIGAEVLTFANSVSSSVIIRHLVELHQQLQPYRSTATSEFLDNLGKDIRDRTRRRPWSVTTTPDTRP